jgi:type I restriction enzyme S subunit
VGWIDKPLFNEPLILVVEDETFVGRTKPFAYRIEGPSWVNNHAHILRPNESTSLKYLHYALMYYPFTPLTTGSTGRRKLTQKALMEAPLYLPDLAEQQRRAESLDRWFRVADQLSKSVATATRRSARLRQAILKKAFEGKLVPQDPSDEPASALLQRIRSVRAHAPTRGRRDRS